MLAHAIAAGMLAELAPEVTLSTWRTPDELRAGLTSGTIDLSVMPVQVAANLYNRGMGVGLVNSMTDGLLHVVAEEGSVADLAGLQGKRLAVPFVNDTPDFVLRALLDAQGLSEAVQQVPVGSPIEAAQMLLAGQIDAALLSEPASTVAIMRGIPSGRHLARVIDLQEEWGRQTGGARCCRRRAGRDAGVPGPRPRTAAAVAGSAGARHRRGAGRSGPRRLGRDRGARDAGAGAGAVDPAFAAGHPPGQPGPPRRRTDAVADGQGRSAIIGGQLPDDGFYLL